MVQAMAGQAGFKLSLRPTEYAAMLAESSKGNFQMDMRGWSGRVDPDGNIFSFVTCKGALNDGKYRSEEHTSELPSLMRISYAVFCLKKKNIRHIQSHIYKTRTSTINRILLSH